MVFIVKKSAEATIRNVEELIILDAQKQPHSIYRKRILGESDGC